MTHRKHAKLKKPKGGLFHLNEFAIIGTPCDRIEILTKELIDKLEEYNFAYADASHNAEEKSKLDGYKDNIHYHEFQLKDDLHIKRNLFKNFHGVFINGNHFIGDSQIVVLNSKKKDSLSRKLDRLTNVVLILTDDEKKPYTFLEEIKGFDNIPVFQLKDIEKIAQWIESYINDRIPEIIGCIFTGGKSVRMGEDKALIDYHGKPQYQYINNEFQKLGVESFLSVSNIRKDLNGIVQHEDEFIGLGPYGGLLTAFKNNPDKAILTCPCDTPFVDASMFKKLIQNRDTTKVATCFYNPSTQFPEPLITIWESHAYPVLLQYLSIGYSCPRKVLINEEVKLIDLGKDSYRLKNVNTPQEKNKVLNMINS